MDGIILIDKPSGWSSFDVIRKLRPVLGVKKMGHAGTLDPMATGLLIVMLGSTCKQQDNFMGLEKTYEAKVELGFTSDTDDSEGNIIKTIQQEDELSIPSKSQVDRALAAFVGDIEQTPPKHSAVKVEGKRAYARARAGEDIKLNSRPVSVYDIYNIEYEYPNLHFSCRVSKGTYIRSLARDIGAQIGAGGYLKALRRTKIGYYSVDDATSPDDSLQKLLDSVRAI